MSKPTTPSNPSSLQSVSALKPSASAWARGPPSASGTPSQSAVNSTAASPNGTPHLAQAPLPAVNKDLSNASAGKSTTAPNAARPQHSRKSSLLAVGANASAAAGPSATSTDSAIPAKPMNIGGRGINFGSVSNPNAELSSSPAANPTTGTHLASTDGVKSFGTVEAADAGKEDKSAVLSRKPAQASNPKFDVNKLFQMPGAAGSSPVVQQARGYDAQGRPVQMGGNSMPPTGAANRLNPQMSPSAGAPSSPGVPNQNPRSPTLGHQQSNSMNPYGNSPGASFRPSNIQSGSVRGPPNQMPGQVNRGQSAHNFGMHPNQQQNYPGMPYGGPQGYYAYGYYGPDSPYGPGPGPVQWQAGQGSTPLSPRAGNATPHNSSGTQHAPSTPGMNGAGGQSMPAANRPSASHNPSNFSSSSQTSGPSTPSQSHARPASFQPGQPFTPGHMSSPSANLHASANAFVPRTKSSAIKITRADGTAVDLATAAKELKTPTPTGGSSASAGGAPGTPVPASTKPNLPAMPVVVRMETEAQKAQRLSDQEAAKTRKAREEKEEKERRERETARREKEEREAVDTKEREEAEVKQKAEEAERIAKEEAATQAAEQKAKEEESARSAAAAEEKKKDEETREQEARQEESERQALKETEKSTVETETDSKSKTPAGLPSKPSAEVLDSARASPAAPALAPPSDGRTSNSPSPVVSPSMAHATLPAKPVAAGSALARKSTPSALNLPASDESSSQQSNAASAQALLTAKPIEKLEDIQYPDGLNSPNVALNTTAQPGKFRYDRDFLLQFMSVCRDKPESLPPLDQLGMERDHASMGRGGSSRGGQRSGSQMGNPRGAGGMGAGIGGGMGSFGGKNAGGMGSFSMGNFNRPPATSEERMAQSRIGNMGNAFGSARNAPGMARTPSQSGPSGMAMMTPGMGRETSRAGSTRGKQRRAEPRGAPSMGSGQFEADVAPLELSANRWTPGVQSRRPGAVDESSPEYVERKVKGLLNKLTKEKFISISDQILEWGNKSVAESDGQTLRLVIKLIFEKAKDEQFWSSMYAELCHKLLETLSPEIKDEQVKAVDGTPLAGGVLFRKYLLNRCQEDFERGWKNKEDASAAAKNKASEDEKNKAAHAEAVAAGKQVEEFKFSDEYYAEQAAKRQGLGLVKFVGELFKLDMLSLKIMNACIVKLLHNIVTPDEEDVESLCQLISTVGGKIQRTSPTAASTLGIFISRMTEMKESPHISSRMKFMLLEVIESYNNGWKSRAGQGQSGPMTIEEVHRQAAKEQADAARAAANAPMSRDASMSRGGSRRGDQRSGYGGMPGASDQWQSVGSRPPPKAADMTGFGKIQIGGGPGTFGPASVFNRNKSKPKSGDVTPPNGVAATNANPFSALGMDDGSGDVSVAEDSSAGSSEPGPQRKRLVLQPRTVSSANVNADANTDAEADAGDSTEAAEGVTSTDEIERKIKADLAEFWGEKGTVGTRNTDDVVSYFEGLSEEGRLELAKRLVDDLFRLSRAEDTSLVAEAFSKSADAGFLTSETIKAALMPSMELLDDVVVDVPLAYAFAAEIITAGKLSADDVEELGDAIEVLGEVSPLPKDKLKTQVEKLQG